MARFLFGPPKTEKKQDNGLVFPSEVGTPFEERNVLRRLQAICEDHELPKLSVYDLRHTHSHLFEGSDRDSAEKMDKLLAPKGKQPVGKHPLLQGRLRVISKKAS